jgi:hypothetical protein
LPPKINPFNFKPNLINQISRDFRHKTIPNQIPSFL